VNRALATLLAMAAMILARPGPLAALPSPLNHSHNRTGTPGDVDWPPQAVDRDNTWANTNRHQHLTGDSTTLALRWDIFGTWDNRAFRADNFHPTQVPHGMILPDQQVRYRFDANVPQAARLVVESAYNDWIAQAKAQFQAKQEAWDAIAIGFTRVDDAMPAEITIRFVPNLDSYGQFDPGTRVIEFPTQPDFGLRTTRAQDGIRKKGDPTKVGSNTTSLVVPVPWSYDGTPDPLQIDLEYNDNSGVGAWHDAPPAGFGKLKWRGGTFGSATDNHELDPADIINYTEMDFRTIAVTKWATV